MITPAPGSPQFNDQLAAIALLAHEPHNLLTVEQAQQVIAQAFAQRLSPVQVLLSHPQLRIPTITILNAIGEELGLKVFDFHSRHQWLREDLRKFDGLDYATLRAIKAIPMVDTSGKTFVVSADPTNTQVNSYLMSRVNAEPGVVLAPVSQIAARLTQLEAAAKDNSLAAALENSTATSAITSPRSQQNAVIRSSQVGEWVSAMFQRAVAGGVSDIHMQFTTEGDLWLRFRKDGVLQQQPHPLSQQQGEEAVNSVMGRCSSIDVTNKLTPQDGTFTTTVAGRRVDARVSTIPNNNHVKLVIRILDSDNIRTRLDDMGFGSDILARLRAATELPQGMVIVSGPTGSGKTTTLYGLLKEVDAVSRNVSTAEDPIEYRLPNITQTQIRSGLGERSVTFARALRAFMRQDPDVILVGEVRDEETAGVAADAAVTGHLVLTTVHANSALGIVTRMRELDVAPSILADAVSVLIAQRLLRRVHDCALEEPPTAEELELFEELKITPPELVKHAVGCPACHSSGYLGRFATVEMIEPTSALRRLIRANADIVDLEAEALLSGFRPLSLAAFDAVQAGVTTLSEMERVIGRTVL